MLSRTLAMWFRTKSFGNGRGSRRVAHRRTGVSTVEFLEQRTLLAAAFPEFVDPNPSVDNGFGTEVVPLSTGNVVVTSPFDDAGGVDAVQFIYSTV